MHRISRWLPALIVVVVAAVTGVTLLGSDDEVAPVEVAANGPRFTQIEELVAAADTVVEGVVDDVGEGRSIGNPADPAVGVRTQLASVGVLAGGPDDTTDGVLIVEQEAELLDGTPITVNGVTPLEAGDRVILLLVRGASEEFPYTTPLNEQAVFYIEAADDGDTIRAADPTGPIGAAFHGGPADALRRAVGLTTDE